MASAFVGWIRRLGIKVQDSGGKGTSEFVGARGCGVS